MVGRHQAGHDRRRTRPEPADEGYLGADPERELGGGMQPLERLHDEVGAVAGQVEVSVHRKLARLGYLDLELHRERRREHVEAGPEVRGGRGHTHQPTPAERHPSTARSIAPSSGSHGKTAPACSSATCGSLRPWPVSTHTTRWASRAPWTISPATLAAEAGSQNTPSFAARNR